jgi:WD40 repeat protein
MRRSGDSTARIWDLAALAEGGPPRATVLRHFNKANEKAKDVTTLDWNASGSLLATGSYDGLARVWSKEGARLQKCTLSLCLVTSIIISLPSVFSPFKFACTKEVMQAVAWIGVDHPPRLSCCVLSQRYYFRC